MNTSMRGLDARSEKRPERASGDVFRPTCTLSVYFVRSRPTHPSHKAHSKPAATEVAYQKVEFYKFIMENFLMTTNMDASPPRKPKYAIDVADSCWLAQHKAQYSYMYDHDR